VQRLVATAALLALILGSFLGGAALAAESSLPGDPLYGLKRLTENVRMLGNTQLAEQFGQRRVEEILQLYALQRAEDVDFSGRVAAMDGLNWQVAGLALMVPADTPGAADVWLNAQIAVHAHTTAARELVAQRISVIEQGELPTPTVAPSVTPTVTITATSTPTITSTPTVTLAPSATLMPMVVSTPLPASSGCAPTAPDDWVSYTIRVGDTLSTLAAQASITLEQLMVVNCIDDARFIVVGQQIVLPFTPAANQSGSNQSGNSGSDDNSGPSENSGSSNADDDDGGGSDDDDPPDDDDD
jgi:LysM repeat protein